MIKYLYVVVIYNTEASYYLIIRFSFYVKRCSRRNKCLGPFEYYDRRSVQKAPDLYLTRWENGVRAECERAIAIDSFKPTTALWSGTEVNVTVRVKNHRILSEGTTVRVTVAGRACEDPRTSPEDEDSLTCTVATGTPTSAVAFYDRVRVVYAGGRELTVESAETFRFVTPRVTRLDGPFCGPLRGGTKLTVRGSGLNVAPSTHVFVQWADGIAVPCHVTSVGDDGVDCSTTAVPAPTGRGRVRVDLDGHGSLFAESRGFEYVNTSRPTADGGPRPSGIASGGTWFAVPWDWPGCVGDGLTAVRFRVYRRAAVVGDAKCRVTTGNEAGLVCRSPTIGGAVTADGDEGVRPDGCGDGGSEPGDGSAPVEVLECRFGVAFAGQRYVREYVHRPCPGTGYAVYADPRFEDFEVNGGREVVIYGRGRLGLGFGAPDVNVTLHGRRSVGPCRVRSVARDRIVCSPADGWLTAERVAELREATVKVGYAATVAVPPRRRRTTVRDEPDHATSVWLKTLLEALLGFIVVFSWCWWWSKRRTAASRRYYHAVRLSDLPAER